MDHDFRYTELFPIYLLAGCFTLAFSSLYILVVPLSSLFWPGDEFHALEMGILISTMFWPIAISGLMWGRFIDKYNRVKIFFIVAFARGVCLILMSFTVMGLGIISWTYFYILILIFAIFAGGNYPTVVSLADDIVPEGKRSRFFGIYNIIRSSFQFIGFVVVGFLVQIGLWQWIFSSIGILMIIAGVIMVKKIKEPKRGIQREELKNVLKKSEVVYNFQIDRETMKKTMLSKTNVVALIEGIFTSVFMGSLTILFLPYIQSPPYNISPFSTGVFLAFFGLTGGLIGMGFFAHYSDKLSKKKSILRIFFIIISLSVGMITFVFLFFIPLPPLTVEEGKDLSRFMVDPTVWIMGIIYLLSTSFSALYNINQPPLLQEINLPEAQGQIIAWNRFLEEIAWGLGPFISGIFITISGQNYQLVSIIIGLFAVPGIILWIFALKWYPKDKEEIIKILEQRSKDLESRE